MDAKFINMNSSIQELNTGVNSSKIDMNANFFGLNISLQDLDQQIETKMDNLYSKMESLEKQHNEQEKGILIKFYSNVGVPSILLVTYANDLKLNLM